jgi:hypothetical protein
MQVTQFTAYTDIVIVGQNFEMADYSNPKGYVYGFSAYVRAVFECGNTRIKHVVSDRWEAAAMAKAEAQAAALNARLTLGKLPVGFDSWEAGRAVYGSDAYQAYGEADELALERNEEFAY